MTHTEAQATAAGDARAPIPDDIGIPGIDDLDPLIGGTRDGGEANANGWLPIETAPKDGTYVLVTNPESGGGWVAKYDPVYPSGYRPENPWSCMMLNTWHLKRYHSTVPTHWQPMPKAIQQSTPTPLESKADAQCQICGASTSLESGLCYLHQMDEDSMPVDGA